MSGRGCQATCTKRHFGLFVQSVIFCTLLLDCLLYINHFVTLYHVFMYVTYLYTTKHQVAVPSTKERQPKTSQIPVTGSKIYLKTALKYGKLRIFYFFIEGLVSKSHKFIVNSPKVSGCRQSPQPSDARHCQYEQHSLSILAKH